jgi:hypothetical protein
MNRLDDTKYVVAGETQPHEALLSRPDGTLLIKLTVVTKIFSYFYIIIKYTIILL